MSEELGTPKLWTLAEVARQLSVSRRTVERLIARGHLVAVKVGRSTRVSVECVTGFVKLQTKGGR